MHADKVAPKWSRYLPGLYSLVRYQRTWLRGDIMAGLTVWAYLIPQVMAYAEIAGLPAVVGLWAIIPALAIYALIGPSRHLSVGPESTTALMTSAGIGALVGTIGVDRYAEVAAVLAMAVGLVCLIGWVSRLGFLASLLSRPVLIGYLVGVSIIMILSQMGKVTGLTVTGDTPGALITSFIQQLDEVHLPTLLLSAITLLILFLFRWLLPRWPGPLLTMLAAAVAVILFDLTREGIKVIGVVPTGLPGIWFPTMGWPEFASLLPAALGIAMVGYSDNVLTSRAFAYKHREKVDASQELLALGCVNIASGLFHGFPVSSSGSRTVLGDTIGSRTQLHSLVAATGVVCTLVFLAPVLESFPTGALGAVVIYAAIRLVDVPELRRIARFRRSELFLTIITTAAVLVFGILAGIGLAVGLSLLELIRRLAIPHDGVLGFIPGLAGMHDIDDFDTSTQVEGLIVYRYDSPLFFANAENFIDRAMAATEQGYGEPEWFLLNSEANVEVDLTAVDTLKQLRDTLEERGVRLCLSRVKQDVRDQLRIARFLEEIGEEHMFATLPSAVSAYRKWFIAKYGRPPAGIPEGYLHGVEPGP